MSIHTSLFQKALLVTGFIIISCGCQTTRPSNIKALQKPALAPMPNYPEERTGWNTNAVIMVFPNEKTQVYLLQLENALRQTLITRGYSVIDKLGNSENDWLATRWRQQAKLVIITGARSFCSYAYEGQVTSDFCMQVLVIDPPCAPFPFVPTPPQIRTFQVWSRAPFSAHSTWQIAYPVHSKLLAENLMRMPNFRVALEPTILSSSPSQNCTNKILNIRDQHLHIETITNTTFTGTISEKDKKLSAQLIGNWSERIVSTITTKNGSNKPQVSTSETIAQTTYRADGYFTKKIRTKNSDWKNSEGSWSLKDGKLYTQTGVTSNNQKLTVSCEYDITYLNPNQMSFHMTSDGYQQILKSTGNSTSGRCWYSPENVLHTVLMAGDFSIESTAKIEPATRIQ